MTRAGHRDEPGVPTGRRGRSAAFVRAAAFARSEQVRYLAVGTYNTAVGYAVFAALLLLLGERVHYTVLLVVAWFISTCNAYVAYRLTVFKVRGHVVRDFVRFCSVYVVALGINVAALPAVVAVTGLPVLVSQGIVVLGTTIGTYAGHKHFSFRRPRDAPDDVSGRSGRPPAGGT